MVEVRSEVGGVPGEVECGRKREKMWTQVGREGHCGRRRGGREQGSVKMGRCFESR